MAQIIQRGIFSEGMAEGMAVGKAKGMAEGRAEGLAVGEARGVAIGKAETVLTFLRAKFSRVPKRIEKTIRSMTDPTALESLAVHVVHCQSLNEFAEALK